MSQTTATKPTYTRSVKEVADIAARAERAAHEASLLPTDAVKRVAALVFRAEDAEAAYVGNIADMKWAPIHDNMFAERRAWELTRKFPETSLLKDGYKLVVEVVESEDADFPSITEQRWHRGEYGDVGFDVNVLVVKPEGTFFGKLIQKIRRKSDSKAIKRIGDIREFLR